MKVLQCNVVQPWTKCYTLITLHIYVKWSWLEAQRGAWDDSLPRKKKFRDDIGIRGYPRCTVSRQKYKLQSELFRLKFSGRPKCTNMYILVQTCINCTLAADIPYLT